MNATFLKYPDLQNYLIEFSRCMTSRIDAQSIILFGGIVLDDFSVKYSDIDLIVVLKNGLTEKKHGIIERAIADLKKLSPVYTKLLYVYFIPSLMIDSPSKEFESHDGLIYGNGRLRSISKYPLSITDDFSIREKGKILFGEDMKSKFPEPPKDCFWKMFINSLSYIEESAKRHPLQFSKEPNDNTTINLLLYFPRFLHSIVRNDLIGKSDSAYWFREEYGGSLGDFLIELARCRTENSAVVNTDELVSNARRLVLFTLNRILEFKGVKADVSGSVDIDSSKVDFQPLFTEFKNLLGLEL